MIEKQVVYGKGVLERFDNSDEKVQAGIESLMVHVQTAYCHTSLGSQIVFERIGDYIYIDKELRICEIEKYEQKGEFTENNIGDANLMVYLGAKYFVFSSSHSLETREKHISFTQLVLLSLYIS